MVMPVCSSSTPSFFLRKSALYPGSKSFARFTFDPGLTRRGLMNFAMRSACVFAIAL
jgi:hypothetical protein